ncbi:MAG TPA: ChaB family protein [Bradyrhizobium sp.]|nr:ChaB family protein [Bradyrhizobium sp.]
MIWINRAGCGTGNTVSDYCDAWRGDQRGLLMPYSSIEDLPEALRLRLPKHAQEIFCAAFNNAWKAHLDSDLMQREVIAYRIAWAAVKKQYRRIGATWIAKDDVE